MDDKELRTAWQDGKLRVVTVEEAQALCDAWWTKYGTQWTEAVERWEAKNVSGDGDEASV